jgi:ankyrin repeat protein
MLKELKMELAERQQIGSGGKKGISLMHRAAFAGMESLLLVLMRMTGRVSNINSVDSDGQTPLHYATIAGQTEAARLLLSQPKLRANEEDFDNRTALQIAVETKRKDIEKILLERADVQQYVDRLASDRQVFVDAANAILVGAALISSITFQGWLQPPLGFTPDYNYQQPYPAPPGTYESFAAVNQSMSLRVFWTLNSLAFFFALATVIAGEFFYKITLFPLCLRDIQNCLSFVNGQGKLPFKFP